MLSNASLEVKKITFIPVVEPPIDNQSDGNQSTNNQSTNNQSNGTIDAGNQSNSDTGDNETSINNGDSGIINSPNEDELNSELSNQNDQIYLGISILTIFLISMMFVIKLRRMKKSNGASHNLQSQLQHQPQFQQQPQPSSNYEFHNIKNLKCELCGELNHNSRLVCTMCQHKL